MLWLYQRIFFGKASEEVEHHFTDLTVVNGRASFRSYHQMVWMGTYTQSFLTPFTNATARLLAPITERCMRVEANCSDHDGLKAVTQGRRQPACSLIDADVG